MKNLFLVCLTGLVAMSCQKDTVTLDNVDIIAMPVLAIPLGEMTLTLGHLLVPDDSLIFEDNMDYKLIVVQDSVFGFNVNDLISLPVQSPSNSLISMGTIPVANVSINQDIPLGTVAADAGLTTINTAHGSNAPFPSLNETNIGTYGGSGFGSFSSASFSNGSMTISLTNDWPVAVSLGIDLVNSSTGSTIASYTLNNASANGGTASDTESLINKTLPSTVGFKITSLTSPGSGSTFVGIDTTDALTLDISSADLEVYNAVTEIATQDISNDTQYIDLGTGGSEELRELLFSTASFDYEFTSTLAETLELTLGFPGSDQNGVEVDTTITITAGATTIGSINLDNAILDLTTDPAQNHSKLPISVTATLISSGAQVSIDSSDALNMTFEMTNLQFGHILGYFGTQQIVIDPGSVPLSVEFLDDLNGQISFAEPSISMEITNSIGLPIELALDFSSYSAGNGFALNGPDYVLPYPTIIGNTETGTLIFDNTNSQIVDVFTLPKDSIVYGGAVNINHDTSSFGTSNFVTNSSSISGDLLMELPFMITASALSFGDTLAQDLDLLSAIPNEVEIKALRVLMATSTTLPLNATIVLRFYDDAWNEIHSESIDLLQSGIPNMNGIVTAPGYSSISVDISGADLTDVLSAQSILAEVLMETYNGGTEPVKLRTDATMGITVGIQVEVTAII